MKKIALYGFGLAGVIAFVVVLASSSVTKQGVKLKTAQACTKNGTYECLPRIGYFDTKDTMWTDELLAGKVVMVNFWATWCKPCQAEVPALTAAYKKYADQGFVLLGVMADDVTDEQLASFSKTYSLDYPVVRVDQDILYAYNYPNALPTTFLYDRAGSLRLMHTGALSASQLEDVLPELLAEAAPAPAAKAEAAPGSAGASGAPTATTRN